MFTPRPSTAVVPPPLRHRVVPLEEVRDRAGVLSVFSSQERKGEWELARHMRIACVMGSAELDLREARIPAGVSEIEIFCLFGSVELIVPPGVRVDAAGDALMGEFSLKGDPTVVAPPGAPVIRIVGSAYMASVEIFVRYAGERPRDARRRIRSSR
jgi:hypothetical protein